MKKNLFVLLAVCAMVLFSCKPQNDPTVASFSVRIAVSDISGTTATVALSASDASTRYAYMVVPAALWNQVKTEYTTAEQQNKALIAEYKSSVVPMTDDEFDASCCATGEVSKAVKGLSVSTDYAVVAFAYSTAKEVGKESFTSTFTTTDERPKDLQFETIEIRKFSASFRAVPQDTTKFFYINLYEKGYVEEAFAGELISTEKDFNETELGMLEYSYYYTNGSEATPYQLATTYMNKGVYEYMFTGLEKNKEYTMIAFFYDWEADEAGDVLYRLDFKTQDGGSGKVYPVDMEITLEWKGAKLVATASNPTQKFLFDALPTSTLSKYATADELAEAVVESYGGSIAAEYCSLEKDSFDYSDKCYSTYYWAYEDSITGFAFGVGDDGKVCSEPVMLKMANPYYGGSSYDEYYYAPARMPAKKAKMIWK